MHGLDLSWLAGGLVAGGLYAVLGPRAHRGVETVATPTSVHTAEGTAP